MDEPARPAQPVGEDANGVLTATWLARQMMACLEGGGIESVRLLAFAQEELVAVEWALRQACERDDARWGAAHPAAQTSAVAYATTLQRLGRWRESEALYRRALAVCDQAADGQSDTLAVALHNLAGLRWQLDDAAEAEALYRRALAVEERRLGADHPETALTANNLGVLLHTQGRTREALALFKRALHDLRSRLGNSHPHTQAARENLQEARKFIL